MWQVVRPQLALAAAITALHSSDTLVFTLIQYRRNEVLSNDVITEYIDYHQDEFSEYYLMGMLDYDDIELR
jgi:hypothetical protein